jgi:LysM repeat protein
MRRLVGGTRAIILTICLVVVLMSGSLALMRPASAQEGDALVYVVQPGDNLFRIGLRFGVSAQDIARRNGILNPNFIYAGQRLLIPRPGSQMPTAMPPTIAPTPTTRFQWAIGMGQYVAITLVQVGAIPPNTLVRIGSATYVNGEWLYDVATEQDVFAQAQDSQLGYAPGVTPGAPTPTVPPPPPTPTIPLPPPTATRPPATNQPSPTIPEFYVVQVGDHLFRIANRFNVSVLTLIELNNLKNPNLIYIGQVLRLRPPHAGPAPTARPATQVPATPAPVPTIPNTAGNVGYAFGLEVDLRGVDPAGITARITDLGAVWVKQPVFWRQVEPQKGQANFAALDAQVEALTGTGARVMLTVSRAPDWARGTNVEDGPAANNADFAAFLSTLASRYQGKVAAYEVWERPNVRREWNGKPISAASYVEMLRVAYAAIKTADSSAIVVSAGLAPTGFNDGLNAINDRVFLLQAYQAGLASYSDAIGVQPAGFANPPDTTCCAASPGVSGWFNDRSFYFRDTLADYRKIMTDSRDSGTFLWVTSFGWGASDGIIPDPTAVESFFGFVEFTDQREQAQYTARAFEIGKALGYVGPMFLSNLNACQTVSSASAPSEFAACYYSLLDPLGQSRPVYDAVKAAAKP